MTTTAKPTALERAQQRRDEALERPITIRCADCLWEAEGGVLEARRQWAEHRRDEHGDPSGMESIARVEKPLTKREHSHGGRKHREDCLATAMHPSTRLCHEHHLQAGRERRAAEKRSLREESEVRTCEEVPGCTNPTVSGRGVYSRVCREHKDLVTQRRREQGLSVGNRRNGSEPADSPPVGQRDLDEAATPPTGEAYPEGSDGSAGGDIVRLAQRVEELKQRIDEMTLVIDDLHRQRDQAIAELGAAVGLIAVAEAA